MDEPRITLQPDTAEHRAAHQAAVRALRAGYRPVLTATEDGTIVVLVAFTADQLNQLLNHTARPPPPVDTTTTTRPPTP